MKGFGARESGYWPEYFVLLSFFTTMLQGILRHFDEPLILFLGQPIMDQHTIG